MAVRTIPKKLLVELIMYCSIFSIAKEYISKIDEESEGEFADCPHFFGQLSEGAGISMDHIIGLTSELFTAGIDSVSFKSFYKVTWPSGLLLNNSLS